MADIPHLALPFRMSDVGAGSPTALVTEQDSEEEVMDCVEVVLRYETGYRLEKPEFGIPDQTFVEGAPDIGAISQALDQWEPRADVVISASPDEFDALISRVKVGGRFG